jgi:hypothetical protein
VTRLGSLEFDDGAPTPDTAERLYEPAELQEVRVALHGRCSPRPLDANGFLSAPHSQLSPNFTPVV